MSYFEITLRILTAIVLGGIIGLERQFKHRPAGFKTHILVCVGSATVMVLSEYLFRKYHAEFGLLGDPTRLGAQVISGIGFLGAGTIIHSGQNVRGLTTAASLWVVAAIGLAAGSGFYFLAIIVSIGIYFILFIFNRLYRRLRNVSDVTSMRIELFNKPKAIGAINLMLAKNNVKILDMEFINTGIEDDSTGLTEIIYLQMELKTPPEINITTLGESIKKITGVIKVDQA